MKIKTLITTSMAAVGFMQVAQANVMPTNFGLYLYDTATGASQYVAITSGTAHFNGTVGAYSLAISTGVVTSDGANPSIDLDVAQATAGAGATSLQIYFSAGGFGPSTGNYTLNTFLATGGPVTTTGYVSAANTAFGTDTLLGGSLDTAGSITANAAGSFPASSTKYSLTIMDTITGSVVSMDSKLSVPDGASTMMLLGTALSGLALARRKFTV